MRSLASDRPRCPAPQATLMATIITGLLNQNLPWGLVLVGIFIAVTVELVRRPFALVRCRSVPSNRHDGSDIRGRPRTGMGRSTDHASQESELGAGTLFSSGLIAGGSIAGILFAILVGTGIDRSLCGHGHGVPVFSRRNAACAGGEHSAVSCSGAESSPAWDCAKYNESVKRRLLATVASCCSLWPAAQTPRPPYAGRTALWRRYTSFPATSTCRTCCSTARLVESGSRLVLRGGEREIPLILNDAKGTSQRSGRSARPASRHRDASSPGDPRVRSYTGAAGRQSAGRGRARISS